jgi:hypothetical protein
LHQNKGNMLLNSGGRHGKLKIPSEISNQRDDRN